MGSTTSDVAEIVNSCAYCRRDATRFCNGCYQAPNVSGGCMETTWYCSGDCQMKDRSSHKFACKLAVDRKSLYRVARITQTAFHRYLEQFFDLGIDRVEKKGADLYLHEALHNDFDKLPLTSNFFPEERDRLSALTYLTCGNALGFVHVLLELMLPDIISKLARVDYTPNNHERRVILISQDGHHNDNTYSFHCIIKANLKNGESYAIDVAGAQYGWYDAVIPWDLYKASRIEHIESVHYLRKIEECQKEASEKAERSEKTQEESFAEVFVAAAKLWEMENGAFEAMLKAREGVFETKQAGLLSAIEAAVIKHKEETQIMALPEAEISKGFNQ